MSTRFRRRREKPSSRRRVAAAANPTDAGAVGALGRALHAWELWSSAHDVYASAATAWRRRAFEWRYLDAVVLQRLARHADAATRLREALAALARLSAGAREARRSAARSRRPRREQARFSPRWSRTGCRDRPPKLGSDASPRPRDSTTRRSCTCGAPSRSFPSSARRTTRSRCRTARSAAATRRERRSRCTNSTARAGRRWTIRCSPRSRRSERTPARSVQRGMKLADAGDLEGAIAAHEAALARDPSLAQAHANLISLYGRARNWAKAEEHYRAARAISASTWATRTTITACCSACRRSGISPTTPTARRSPSIRMHAHAHNNLGQILERQRQLEDAADAYRRAVESQPAFRLARFNLGRMLIALGRPGEAVSRAREAAWSRATPKRPRYLFALRRRARPRRAQETRGSSGRRKPGRSRCNSGSTIWRPRSSATCVAEMTLTTDDTMTRRHQDTCLLILGSRAFCCLSCLNLDWRCSAAQAASSSSRRGHWPRLHARQRRHRPVLHARGDGRRRGALRLRQRRRPRRLSRAGRALDDRARRPLRRTAASFATT